MGDTHDANISNIHKYAIWDAPKRHAFFLKIIHFHMILQFFFLQYHMRSGWNYTLKKN